MISFPIQYFSASYTRSFLLDFGIEDGLPMDVWCPHFISTEQEAFLKKDKTRDMGILTSGWVDVVKAFKLKADKTCVFDFVVENNIVCLDITPL